MKSFKISLGDAVDSDQVTSGEVVPLTSDNKSGDGLFWMLIVMILVVAFGIGIYSFGDRLTGNHWKPLQTRNGNEYSYQVDSPDRVRIRMNPSEAQRTSMRAAHALTGVANATAFDHTESEVRFSDDFKQYALIRVRNMTSDNTEINSFVYDRGWQSFDRSKDDLPVEQVANEMAKLK